MSSEKVLSVEESEATVCEWYGHRLLNHQWHDTVDGYQRCANCKHVRTKPTEPSPEVAPMQDSACLDCKQPRSRHRGLQEWCPPYGTTFRDGHTETLEQIATRFAPSVAPRETQMERFLRYAMGLRCKECSEGKGLLFNSAHRWAHNEAGNCCNNSDLYQAYVDFISTSRLENGGR